MNCSIQSCPGQYERREIPYATTTAKGLVVVKDIPAEVCNFCGDTMLSKEVVDHLLNLLKYAEPNDSVPALKYVGYNHFSASPTQE